MRALSCFPKDVLAEIQANAPGWEEHVPLKVAELIKERRLFRYPSSS